MIASRFCRLFFGPDSSTRPTSESLVSRYDEFEDVAYHSKERCLSVTTAPIVLEDIAKSEEIEIRSWRSRPLHSRLAENFCSLLTPIL